MTIEATDKTQEDYSIKQVELRVSAQLQDNPEQFNEHAQQAITAFKQGEACWDQEECARKLKGSQIGLR
jgi:hypothetical protein